MTVGAQVKQTLASLKSARTTLEAFAEYNQNNEVKAVFEKNILRLDGIIKGFENRLKVLEFEEPQYKGF